MALDNESLSFIKEWIIIPMGVLFGLAWRINEKEHAAMLAENAELKKTQEALKTNTSNGYSVLNDRVMEYIDGRVNSHKHETDERFKTTNAHITKLFENAEKDRALGAERHIELLQAIHGGLSGKADK